MTTETFDLKLACAVRSWASEARRGLDSHPQSDTLLDYHDGTLKGREAEKLREHLAWCRQCSQLGLDLALFARPILDKKEVQAELEIEGEWVSAPQAREPTKPVKESHWLRRVRPRIQVLSGGFLSQIKLSHVTVALLSALCFGLLHELIEIRTSSRELRGDIQLLDLQPVGVGIKRDAGNAGAVLITEVDAPLVLILSLLEPGSYVGYQVDVLDSTLPDQGSLWKVDDLKVSSEGYLTLLVPPGLMAAGEYRVLLYGVDQEQADLLAEYLLKFRAS